MRLFAFSILCLYLLQSGMAELCLALVPAEEEVEICCATRDANTPCCCLPPTEDGDPVSCDLGNIVGQVMRPAPCNSGMPVAFYGPSARATVYHLVPASIDLGHPPSFAASSFRRFGAAYSLHLDLPDKVPII